jgi:hypothetical protein
MEQENKISPWAYVLLAAAIGLIIWGIFKGKK